MTLHIQKISAHIGARVSGIDPSAQLDAATVAELRAALLEHKAIVLDAPHLDADGQVRFASYFGDLTTAHPTVPGLDGAPNVLDVDSERGVANVWHTDVTFVVNPPAISTLRSITIPPYGGETLIASSAAAYRSLPEPLRAWADTLWAVHTNVYDYARAEEATPRKQEYREVFQSTVFESRHPVVRVHPETGERGLFLGGFARRIEGLSESESRDVIRLLQAHVTRPEHVLRWSWQPGQVLVFDNRITQHYAIDNYDSQPRKLARITVAGDVPLAVNGERSQSLVGDASHYTPSGEAAAAAAA
jgi:alpha-ketoglutarate-dependent sulfate ester dioxygenase